MADHKELQIPDGDTGEYFISYDRIVQADGTLDELNELLTLRSLNVPGGICAYVSEEMDGVRIKWGPNRLSEPSQRTLEIHER